MQQGPVRGRCAHKVRKVVTEQHDLGAGVQEWVGRDKGPQASRAEPGAQGLRGV